MAPECAGRTRVLVVDDDPDILSVVQEVLTDAGYDVVPAVGGMAAKQLLARSSDRFAEVVLLDLMMPFVPGIEVLRELREHPDWADVPVIIMTASRTRAEQVERQDFQGFIAKPFDIDQILFTVSEVAAGDARLAPAFGSLASS